MAGIQNGAARKAVPNDEFHLPHHIVHAENSSEEYLPQHYDADTPGATTDNASGRRGLQDTGKAAGGGAGAAGYGRSSPDLKTAEDQIRANHRTRVLVSVI